ncbi:MAG: peptidoglycan DD-metalloendopeptidase family protein [Methylococcaceae bacterium]|nr:peptidoglycan DD-metalloendopeptidase family protein [Methylococcaceae bacterium]
MRVIRFIIVFSLVFTGCPESGWSEVETEEKKKQLEVLQGRIRLLQSTLDDLENKKNSVRAELRDNERLYGNIFNALKRVKDDIAAQEQRLQKVRRDRDLSQRKMTGYKSSLVGQIRATHAMGRQERLQMILNQDDPSKAGRQLAYHNYFNNARVAEIKAFHAVLEELKTSEQELLAGTERLIRLQQDKEAEADSLEESRKARNLLLAKLDRDYRDRNSELKLLKQDEHQLQSLIQSVEMAAKEAPYDPGTKQSFLNLQGRLHWPVRGKLVQRYGTKTHWGQSNGVLIRAREGEPVRVISDGRVVYADWLVRYGLLMIVDHGKGFMTLYAFNQSLYKSVGDTVKSGEQIATVGRSGGRSIPALYFEVRKNGRPVNPMKWCKKVAKDDVG